LRIVMAGDLGRVPLHRSIVRALVKAVLGVPVFLAVYFTAKNQGLHDLVAGTVVIPSDSADTRNGRFEAEKLASGGLRPRSIGAGLLVNFIGTMLFGVGYAVVRIVMEAANASTPRSGHRGVCTIHPRRARGTRFDCADLVQPGGLRRCGAGRCYRWLAGE